MDYTQRCADFPFAGALAKFLLSAEHSAMPTLSLDSQARLAISKAILESTDERKAVRIIPLPDGGQLLMLAHFGHVSFDLIVDADDLFNPHLIVDVSALVADDLKNHRA
ncbi:hypothetical protein [Pseudomonas hormoni]